MIIFIVQPPNRRNMLAQGATNKISRGTICLLCSMLRAFFFQRNIWDILQEWRDLLARVMMFVDHFSRNTLFKRKIEEASGNHREMFLSSTCCLRDFFTIKETPVNPVCIKAMWRPLNFSSLNSIGLPLGWKTVFFFFSSFIPFSTYLLKPTTETVTGVPHSLHGHFRRDYDDQLYFFGSRMFKQNHGICITYVLHIYIW